MSKINLEKINKKVIATIICNGDEWKEIIKKSKKSLIDNLELKGFRKGNVPKEIAEKKITDSEVWNKASNNLLEKKYPEAIDLLIKENIIAKPQVNITKISNDEIEVKLESVAMPEINIGDLSKINNKLIIEKPTKEDIEKEIKNLDSILKANKEIKDKNHIIKNDDIVNINFLGKVNGKEFEGGKADDFDLTIGSKQFIDNFEEQLIGLKAGDSKKVKVTFPKAYPQENLANKEAEFDVKINSIKSLVDLEGDELKEKLSMLGFESKEEIIEKIESTLIEQKANTSKDNFLRKYIEEISNLKDTKIDIPNELIDQEIEVEIKNFEQELEKNGTNLNDYLKHHLKISKDEFVKQTIKDKAAKKIKDGLIYSKLVEHFKIEIKEKDVNSYYSKLASDNKTDLEKIKSEISQDMLQNQIIFDKLIEEISK